ncbi:MAG TPA: hypothetical protein PKC87_00165 [Candidatus Absconditabacterales bacterium]|nr:hypothetical protein [Candidatus Absconditabacterales bacterium]
MARKFQNGEVVTVTDKFPKYLLKSWGLEVGNTLIINSLSYDGHYHVKKSVDSKLTHRVPTVAIAKITGGKRMQLQEQIEKAEEQIKRTKAFIRETKAKITFMDETGSETFDENEFKAYQTLSIIEKGDLTKIEKAKAIAALINKK